MEMGQAPSYKHSTKSINNILLQSNWQDWPQMKSRWVAAHDTIIPKFIKFKYYHLLSKQLSWG